MGFTNGTGPQGSPTFNNTPQTVADLTRLRDLVLQRGTRLIGTTTERNTFSNAGYAVEGMRWYDTTMKAELIRIGADWKREVSYRIFNFTRAGMTDNQAFFQVPTEDTTKDTEPAFSYTLSLERIKLEPGIYLVSAKGHAGANTTGQSYIQIRGTAQGQLPGGIGPVSRNSDPWMACTATFRADGAEELAVDIYKQTGGSTTGTGVLTITKLTTL